MATARRPQEPLVNYSRFSLYAPMGDNKRAQLVFSTSGANPRLTCFYPKKDMTDPKTPIAMAAMGTTDCLAFIDICLSICQRQNNTGQFVEVENIRNTYENGSDKPTGKGVSSSTVFGRDDEGRYYIKIIDKMYTKPDVSFYFDRSDWHVFYIVTTEGRKPISRHGMSQFMAESWLRGLRDIILKANMPAASGVGIGNPGDQPAVAAPEPTKKAAHEDLPY